MILDAYEGEGEENEEHCTKRWRELASTLLGEQMAPAPKKIEDDEEEEEPLPDESMAGGTAFSKMIDYEPEPEPDAEAGTDGDGDGEEDDEEEEWEEDEVSTQAPSPAHVQGCL